MVYTDGIFMREEEIKLNIIKVKDMENIIKKSIENGRRGEKIEVKTGIIEKFSFEPIPHMVVNIRKGLEGIEGEEKIWLEGPTESFAKGNYLEGIRIEIRAKNVGTIVGECDFGKIDPLPLYVADYVKIIV